MTFNSLDALYGWMEKQGWQYATTSSGLTMRDILLKEAERLKSCFEKAIGSYYDSYSPSGIVPRTGNLQDSLVVDKVVKISSAGKTMSVQIDFDQAMIMAESIFGSDSSNYNTASLINDGWQVRPDVSFSHIEHFGFYDGFDFVRQALDEFYSDNPYNIKVHVEGFKNNYD